MQRQFPVIALGQVWRDLDGDRLFVYLNRHGDGRRASLGGRGGDWNDVSRFAAVRKST
jgi:hypothetical protein